MPICQRCGANLTSYLERKSGVCILCEHSPTAVSPVVVKMELSAISRVVRPVPREVAAIGRACLVLSVLGILFAVAIFVAALLAGATPTAVAVVNMMVSIPLNIMVASQGVGLLQLQKSTLAVFTRKAWILYFTELVIYAVVLFIFVAAVIDPSNANVTYHPAKPKLLEGIAIAGFVTYALFTALALGRAAGILARPETVRAFEELPEETPEPPVDAAEVEVPEILSDTAEAVPDDVSV